MLGGVHMTPAELSILGSAFALGGVALGAFLGRGQARRERLAAARTELYEQVLRAAFAMMDDREGVPGERTDVELIEQLRARLGLLGHPAVVRHFFALITAQGEWWKVLSETVGSGDELDVGRREAAEQQVSLCSGELMSAIRREVNGRRHVGVVGSGCPVEARSCRGRFSVHQPSRCTAGRS